MNRHRRLYSAALALVAVFGIATVLLPWLVLPLPGLNNGWNGIGRTRDEGLAAAQLAPEPRGWWVIAACVVVLLAAGSLLSPKVTDAVASRALWTGAACSAAAAAVPITVLAAPNWYLGDFFAEIGAPELADQARDLISIPMLSFCLGALVLLAILCAATALTLNPLRWRITVTRAAGSPPSA